MEEEIKYGKAQEEAQSVFSKLSMIRRKIREDKLIGKDAQNLHKNYKYFSPDTVLNVVNPLLEEHGLIVVFQMMYNPAKECYEAIANVGNIEFEGEEWRHLKFQFDIFKGAVAGANESQNSGSTLTYAKRYSYMNIFDLVDAKDDFDHDSKQPIVAEEKTGKETFDQTKLDKCTSKAEAKAYFYTLTKEQQENADILQKFSSKKYE